MAPISTARSNPVPSQETYAYGYPADAYYVVLPPAPHLNNRRRNRRLLAYAAALAISLGLFLGAAFYFFWPSQPGIQVISVNFNDVNFETASQSGSIVPRLFMNISMDMAVKVSNKDYFSLEYDKLDIGLGYRGRRIGVVESEGGRLPARHTSYVNSTLELDGIEILHDIVYLLEDLVRKELPLDTVVGFNGSVHVLFAKIPLKVGFAFILFFSLRSLLGEVHLVYMHHDKKENGIKMERACTLY